VVLLEPASVRPAAICLPVPPRGCAAAALAGRQFPSPRLGSRPDPLAFSALRRGRQRVE